MMAIEITRWDAADHLVDDEMMLAYVEAAFEDGDPALIAAALNDVARARGASDAGLTADVGLDAIIRALKTLGLELTAKAA